jgi:hypothetical protein
MEGALEERKTDLRSPCGTPMVREACFSFAPCSVKRIS